MTDAARPHRSSWGVLRQRQFATFWSAALVSNTGTWMQLVAVPFVIFQMTHSTTWLGVAAFAAYLPNTCSSILGGPLADRHSRKQILLVTQAVQMVLAFTLWLVWAQGWATPGMVVVIIFLTGIVSGVNITAWQAFVTQLVDHEHLMDAVRMNSLQFTGARAFGPAIAGLVLQVAGASTAFLLNAVSYLVVLGALLAVRPRAQEFAPRAGSVIAQVREGLGVARRDATVSLAIVLVCAVSFLGSSVLQLAPAIAKDLFDVGSGAYGLMVGAFGAGAVVGSMAMAFVADRVARSVIARVSVVVLASGLLVLALAPQYAVGLVGLFVMGIAYLGVTTQVSTALQARVSDVIRARVLSVYLAALALGVPFGALIGGKLASLLPLRAVLVGYGLALVLIAIVLSARCDKLRPLDRSVEDDDDLPARDRGRRVRLGRRVAPGLPAARTVALMALPPPALTGPPTVALMALPPPRVT